MTEHSDHTRSAGDEHGSGELRSSGDPHDSPEAGRSDDTTATVDAWLAAYTEPDATSRRAAVARLWAPEGRLVEPPLDGAGHDGIDALAVAVQAQFAGCRFRRTSRLDEHHATARYEWELVAADGSVVLAGEDVARLGADGRLVEVVGFFGRLAGPA